MIWNTYPLSTETFAMMNEIPSLKTFQCNHDIKLIFQAKRKLQSGSQFVSDNLHLNRKPIYSANPISYDFHWQSNGSWVVTKNRVSFSIHCQSGYHASLSDSIKYRFVTSTEVTKLVIHQGTVNLLSL